MAGSYTHVRGGWSLIEDMGDAHEAVAQLLWLVESEIGARRASALLNARYYPMVRGEMPKDRAYVFVEKAMGT